jgi:uncharacterized Fe-S radical SAM superfamily protein PflX
LHFAHFGEENCPRGRGSGPIFFSGYDLRCVFCQNHVYNTSSYDSPRAWS